MAKPPEPRTTKPFEIRLPRFVTEREVGLGDAASRAARAFGLRPCGGCARRAEAMNRWAVITPRRR